MLARDFNSVLRFTAVDEAHCVSTWGKELRPSYQDLGFLRVLFPSEPIMIVSATLPPVEFQVAHDVGLRNTYASICQPLNHYNIVYAIRRKQSILVDISCLVASVESRSYPEGVPKTVVFCRNNEVCYNVYVHLWRCVTDHAQHA